MKTWKLVSGILSIVIFIIVEFQSCAAGLVNTLEENGGTSGSIGLFPLLPEKRKGKASMLCLR